jgi:hypothetical protein
MIKICHGGGAQYVEIAYLMVKKSYAQYITYLTYALKLDLVSLYF